MSDVAPESQDLIYEVKDGIGLITLNRPKARNALTFEMYGQIADILEAAPTDGSLSAIVITGHPASLSPAAARS